MEEQTRLILNIVVVRIGGPPGLRPAPLDNCVERFFLLRAVETVLVGAELQVAEVMNIFFTQLPSNHLDRHPIEWKNYLMALGEVLFKFFEFFFHHVFILVN
jgi:hypothetical protein